MPGESKRHALISQLRFKHLNLLNLLDSGQNVHHAAQHMHLSQPAASKMLQEVERILGFAVFERLPRGVRPTQLGECVIRYARAAVNDLEKFGDELSARQQGGYGHLSIGAISAASPGILSNAVARMKARRPLLTIKLVEQSSDQLVIALEQKQLDLAIGRFTEVQQHNLFEFEPVSDEALWLVAGKGHPLAGRHRVEMTELGGCSWILHPPTSPMRRLLEESFASHGMRTPEDIVETPSIFPTLQLLLVSNMITVQPRSAVQGYVERGILDKLSVEFDKELNSYGILTRKHESQGTIVGEFIETIRALAQES